MRWILVYPNADEDSEKIQNSFREYDLSSEASSDTNHTLVKSAQVGVTLEAAVHLPALAFLYRGRIEDRPKVTNGLRQAVNCAFGRL